MVYFLVKLSIYLLLNALSSMFTKTIKSKFFVNSAIVITGFGVGWFGFDYASSNVYVNSNIFIFKAKCKVAN